MIDSKNMRLFLFLFIALGVLSSIVAQERATQNPLGETILVEIGDTYITANDLREKIDTLPTMHSARFRTVGGQSQILEMMITEQMFYLRALELGIDQLEEVKNAIFINSQPISNNIYFEEVLSREFRFDPQSVERFYNENIANFTILPRVTIQHLQTNQENLELVLSAINRGEDFLEIIQNYSINEETARQGGIIRNIRLNGVITGIGHDIVLDRHITEASVNVNQIIGPIETGTGIHFFKKIEYEPGEVRPFSEARNEIENRMRGQGEHEVYRAHIETLYRRYNVVYMYDLLEMINPFNIHPDQRDSYIVQSTRPDIRITFGEIGDIIRAASRDMMIDINNKDIQDRFIRTEIDRRLLNAASADANIFENYQNRTEMQEVRLRVILSFFQAREINDKITITREELYDFYENNTERYTVPASRNIRQFIATDERAARTHHRAINRMLRRDQHTNIAEYITNHSIEGQNGGLLTHIYRNNLVPTVGMDENYNNMIFEARIGQLSDVFRNVNGQIVFFYVIDEVPARVRPLPEIENSLMGIIHRQKATERFEQLREELFEMYNVRTHFNRIVADITPEELFNHAETTQRIGQISETIAIFDAIIADYDNTEYAYRALFMKGFIAAEHLDNNNIAIQAFQNLLEKFPDGELNESAQFMLEALINNVPLEDLFGQ